MKQMLYAAVCAALLTNGLWMVVEPQRWYQTLPGVSATGPFNIHFIRDIGCIYLVAGAGLLWRWLDPPRGWPAALAGALFLAGHALLHVFEGVDGFPQGAHLFVDLSGVYLPALLALWLALPDQVQLGPGMVLFKRYLHRQMDDFERSFDYDGRYIHEMLDFSLDDFLRFSAMSGLSAKRGNLPLTAWYAARITAIKSEDCGPCTELTVRMAQREGLDAGFLAQVLTGDVAALDDDASLAVRLTKSTLARASDALEVQEQAETRWGREGLYRLALVLAASRVYPTIKYAVGHGKACYPVRIGDSDGVAPLVVAPGLG